MKKFSDLVSFIILIFFDRKPRTDWDRSNLSKNYQSFWKNIEYDISRCGLLCDDGIFDIKLCVVILIVLSCGSFKWSIQSALPNSVTVLFWQLAYKTSVMMMMMSGVFIFKDSLLTGKRQVERFLEQFLSFFAPFSLLDFIYDYWISWRILRQIYAKSTKLWLLKRTKKQPSRWNWKRWRNSIRLSNFIRRQKS